MQNKDYFIKNGYKPNLAINTIDDNKTENLYWNEKAISRSYYYQFFVYQYVANLIKKYKLKTIIDVGCGSGKKLSYIHKKCPNINIIGIDQKSAINYCKKTYNFGTWLINDFENNNYENLSRLNGDIVIFSDVIEHLLDPDIIIPYLKNLMKSNSFLVISTPERDNLHGKNNFSPKNFYHIREWNSQEFSKFLIFHSFEIIDHKIFYPTKIDVKFLINHYFTFYNEYIKRIITKKQLKYNQMYLVRKKD